MNVNVEFEGRILTADEIEACRKVLKEIRAKKDHDRLVQLVRKLLSFEISCAVEKIGLDETKRIVRSLLRECKEEEGQA